VIFETRCWSTFISTIQLCGVYREREERGAALKVKNWIILKKYFCIP
jgi:hypothetical protein